MATGGCGKRRNVTTQLAGAPPQVFIVQLSWETVNEASDCIAHTLACISQASALPA